MKQFINDIRAAYRAWIDAQAEAELRRVLGDKYINLKGMQK